MNLNDNSQELWETSANEVHNDTHVTKTSKINILPENQDDQSLLTSQGHSKSS